MNFDHLDQEGILRYLRGEAPQAEAESTQAHLAFCDSCALRFDTLKHIQGNFEAAWNELADALVRLAPPGVTRATAEPGRPDYVLRALFDFAREIVTVGTAQVSALARDITGVSISLEPYAAGVGSPQALEAERHRRAAAEWAGEGESERALAELAEAAARLGGSARLAEVRLERAGHELGRIIADSHHRSLHVIVWPSSEQATRPASEGTPPHAVLMRQDGFILDTRRLVPADGARYMVADFQNVDHAEVLVGIHAGQ